MKEHEQRTELQNKKVYESRLKLSEDVRKGEQIWTEAKKKSEANKSAAINSFAQGLIELSD